MDQKPQISHDGWEGGWVEHETRQLLRMARLSLSEKLEWLEEAQELALYMNRSRRAQDQARPTCDE